MALPFPIKMRALEEMCDHSRETVEYLRSRGLPYFDPHTNELVRCDGGECHSLKSIPPKVSPLDAAG